MVLKLVVLMVQVLFYELDKMQYPAIQIVAPVIGFKPKQMIIQDKVTLAPRHVVI